MYGTRGSVRMRKEELAALEAADSLLDMYIPIRME